MLAAATGLLLGVLGFDRIVQRTHTPSESRIEAAHAFLASQGKKDYRLRDCRIPLSGDEMTMNCRADTPTGRTRHLSFGFTPEGTVAVVCEIGTEGCDGW